jgi:hypothetical protein
VNETAAPAFASARPQSRVAVAVLVTNIVAGVLAMVVYVAFLAVDRLAVTLDDSQVVLVDYLITGLLGIYYVTIVVALATFAVWLQRIAANMPSLGAVDPRYRSGGGAYLHPAATTIDAWKGATSDRLLTSRRDRWFLKAPLIYRVWWTLPVSGAFAWFYFSRRQPIILFIPSMNVISLAFFIAAAVLTIVVIRQVTTRQDRKQELILTGRLV